MLGTLLLFDTQYPRPPCVPDRCSLHPTPANHGVRSAVQRISAALLDAWLQRLSEGMHCRNLHPTSSPTTSRSPSVLGRSDRTESLDGSVISFVLLHRRLLQSQPTIVRGCHHVAHMAHSTPDMAEVVSMRLSLQHVQVRPERPSKDPTDNFSSCQSPSSRPSAMDI